MQFPKTSRYILLVLLLACAGAIYAFENNDDHEAEHRHAVQAYNHDPAHDDDHDHDEDDHHDEGPQMLGNTVNLIFTIPSNPDHKTYEITTAMREYELSITEERERSEILHVFGQVFPTDKPDTFVVEFHINTGHKNENSVGDVSIAGSHIFKKDQKFTIASINGKKVLLELEIVK